MVYLILLKACLILGSVGKFVKYFFMHVQSLSCYAFWLPSKVARLAAKYNVSIERIKEGRYVVEGKINIFVRVSRKW